MERIQKFAAAALSLILMFGFVQVTGNYLIGELSRNAGQAPELPVAEEIEKQMVLQLEPVEYYTFQLGLYEDAEEAQEKIQTLAQAGYRVCVSSGPPYAVWLGCFGLKPAADTLPEEIRSISPDLFVQKQILNETMLKFYADDKLIMEQVSALLSSYDVVLKHSLQMFQDYRYDVCSPEIWEAMTAQIIRELRMIQESAERLLLDEASEPVAGGIRNLLSYTVAYCESLEQINEKQNDRAVLLAQSCFMELIGSYHGFMRDESSDKINL